MQYIRTTPFYGCQRFIALFRDGRNSSVCRYLRQVSHSYDMDALGCF